MKRLTRFGAVALAAALVAPLTGCAALISSQQTAKYHYNGGDGAATSIDGVDVRGILLISDEDQEKAQLFYTLVNNTDKTADVSIKAGDKSVSQTVKAGEKFSQDPQNPNAEGADEVIVSGLNQPTGTLVDVTVTVNGNSEDVQTQILDGSHWYYKTLEPSSAPSATDGATDDATEDSTTGQ